MMITQSIFEILIIYALCRLEKVYSFQCTPGNG